MTKEEFDRFRQALIEAEVVPLKEFEKKFTLKVVCQLKSWRSWRENYVIWSDEASRS